MYSISFILQTTIIPGISYLLIATGAIFINYWTCLLIAIPPCLLAMTFSFYITRILLKDKITKWLQRFNYAEFL